MPKNTLNGSKAKAIKVSGFLARSRTKSGQKILARRRKKKRMQLALY